MGFCELLEPGAIALPLEARDKWEAIRRLTALLVETGRVGGERFEEVLQALIKREKELSTGMEKGIAIPHASVDLPGEALAVLGLAPQGIPFESLDGEPARIIVLLVTPHARRLRHLRTLSEIVRLLGDPGFCTRLLEQEEPEQVLEMLRRREQDGG